MFTRSVDVGVAVRDKVAAISTVIKAEEKKKNRLKGVELLDDSTVQLTFSNFFEDDDWMGRIVRARQFPKEKYNSLKECRKLLDDEAFKRIRNSMPNRKGRRPYWALTEWEVELPDVFLIFVERTYANKI